MPKVPRRLEAIPVPTLHQQYLSVIKHSTHCIFSLDPETLSLRIYHWPIEEERRVAPDALRSYRETHEFLGPCCLCPLLGTRRGIEQRSFTEAAIHIPIFGYYAGEYVAECAQSRCGYLVPLERLYSRIGVPVKRYPPKEAGEISPPLCLHRSEICWGPRSLQRTYARADLNDAPLLETRVRPEGVDLGYETDWRKFTKLDRLHRPGLSEKEFYGLFARCASDACGLVMTRQVFPGHYCRRIGEDGLELTDEE